MNEYHKIQTLFKRDMEHNGKLLLEGQWTLPEFEYLAKNDWVFTEYVNRRNVAQVVIDKAKARAEKRVEKYRIEPPNAEIRGG